MSGPTCEVLLAVSDERTLDAIDVMLAATAEQIDRTRKGRAWGAWIQGRPVNVAVLDSPPSVTLSAGCNEPVDYDILRSLAVAIASAVDGIASEPQK